MDMTNKRRKGEEISDIAKDSKLTIERENCFLYYIIKPGDIGSAMGATFGEVF